MTFDVSDVHAALLYARTPPLDFDRLAGLVVEWCEKMGLAENYTALPDAAADGSFCFSGNGARIQITLQDQPLDATHFALPLRSPILKHKPLDFAHAIDAHKAVVLISVSNEIDPLAADTSDDSDAAKRTTLPFANLVGLHMAVQVVSQMQRPLMVEFGPSQSLLSPQEIAAVSEELLPITILFHPFPFRAKTKAGSVKQGMAAIHAQHLIGAELELEAIPDDMPVSERINTLSALITLRMEDIMPLAHGDSVQMDSSQSVSIRHEKGSIEDGPRRIIASFDPADSAGKNHGPQDQKTFQDRIAQLKQKKDGAMQAFDAEAHAPAGDALVFQESKAELVDRVKSTITTSPEAPAKRRMLSPLVLMVFVAVGGYVFVAQSDTSIATLASAFSDPLREAEQTEQTEVETSVTRGTEDLNSTAFGKTIPAVSRP